jgi:hemerythrin-like domain-containing protein
MLKTLKVELFAHFAHEEKTLYKYLDALYKNDEDNRELVKEFNKSMHDIQIFVEDFMEKYTDSAVNYDDEFIKDFDGLVEALAKRIDTEENHLYSLYNKKIKTIDESEFLQVERTAEDK